MTARKYLSLFIPISLTYFLSIAVVLEKGSFSQLVIQGQVRELDDCVVFNLDQK